MESPMEPRFSLRKRKWKQKRSESPGIGRKRDSEKIEFGIVVETHDSKLESCCLQIGNVYFIAVVSVREEDETHVFSFV